MKNSHLIINANTSEVRVALLEDDSLAEIFIERKQERGYLGNIYKGKVTRVLPGMQAAFVEIGEDRSAFLYGGDVIDPGELTRRQQIMLENPGMDFYELRDEITQTPIEKLLKQGQHVVVQVIKEPIGTKGARVSMFLSLPGRYLVLIPHFSHIGISRRISNEQDRQRLRDIMERIKPADFGVILRTAALDASEDLLQKDLEFLVHSWKTIDGSKDEKKPPALLYREADIHIKALRDLYKEDIESIVVDNETVLEDLKTFLEATVPGASQKLQLYADKAPIFDAYGVEFDLARALSRKVWLPSGGYLVVDQAEALSVFDVNTGKFVGKLSARDTILKTNLEAAEEIASQLRLRNIGGIIVIDFIDMEPESDREKVYTEFASALQKDKAKINILKISELGLVQMTRKRTSESLERSLTEECPYCTGLGHVKSKKTISLDLLRDIERHSIQTKAKKITVETNDDVKLMIMNEDKELFDQICKKHKIIVEFSKSSLNEEELKHPPYEIH